MRCWHSRGRYTVLDDPFKLTITIPLHLAGSEGGNGWGKCCRERDARVLSVKTVAYNAVMTKGVFAALDVFWRRGAQRIFWSFFPFDAYMQLEPLNCG